MTQNEEISKLFGIKKSNLKHILSTTDVKNEAMLRDVFNDALDYFGTKEGTRKWFMAVNRGLGSVTPLSLLNRESGIERVHASINILRHGMTA